MTPSTPEPDNPLRSYPRNSPEAAGRIVALVLMSDGQMSRTEFDTLQRLGAERALGMEPHLLPHLVHTVRQELLQAGHPPDSPLDPVDDRALAFLMAEISDPALQRTVLRLSLAAARADGRLADGETVVVKAARRHWQLVDGEEAQAPKKSRRRAA